MEAWPQPSLTFSPSLPTNSSLSSLTSSSPPPPPPTVNPSVVDLVDELWFFRSVLPFPSLTFPCLPSPFSSSHSPDSSTLLAQLMCSNPNRFTAVALSPSPRLPLSSSPPPQQQEEQPPLQNQQLQYSPRPFSSHYAYLPPSNGEDEDSTEEEEDEEDEEEDDDEEEAEPADPLSLRAYLDAEDALSGIYDVGVLLKDQHLKRRRGGLSATLELQVMSRRELREDRQESQNINTKVKSSKVKGLRELDTVEMTPHVANVLDVSEGDRYQESVTLSYAPFHTEAWSLLSTLPNLRVSAPNEQVDMKEHLKLWAHAVALTLHWES